MASNMRAAVTSPLPRPRLSRGPPCPDGRAPRRARCSEPNWTGGDDGIAGPLGAEGGGEVRGGDVAHHARHGIGRYLVRRAFARALRFPPSSQATSRPPRRPPRLYGYRREPLGRDPIPLSPQTQCGMRSGNSTAVRSSAAHTSSRLLPAHETMPRPVTTTSITIIRRVPPCPRLVPFRSCYPRRA
jgi:hypothetical protein